jgi:hypothetical protein
MSYNKISRARNLLNEARGAIGEIKLDPEVHRSVLILIIGVYDSLGEAVAILSAPPKPRHGRPTLAYSRGGKANDGKTVTSVR